MRKPKSKLAYYRMLNFLSQEDVAKQLEISQQYYGRLEKNAENINLGMAIKLKRILKLEAIEDIVDYQEAS